ncbi:hybrid sensor histidine kinase/response regulator [Kiritimatiella glycovorans]|uniref:Sensory/regulatory protein RpfC n=1 Tax=Kiritimatiella glycovorans TaxID=1307763 RepID=A0A0G3EFR1_9BACT|nr:response regulator [Kiritimatiella glycovorans]AKJ64242.1 Signal transduction histidine-protein kinase BarA [Kiritimatiella glycovorans]
MPVRLRWLCLAVLMACPAVPAADTPVRIGVLAKRGPDRCLQRWSRTAEYLSDTLSGYTFTIVPLGFEETAEVVANRGVEFILANSAVYVELAARHGAARIATLNNLGPNRTSHSVFGSAAIFRLDQNRFPSWEDLKGARVAAVNERSFGGWLAARREIRKAGLRPERDFASLSFRGTHDAVVCAVRDGEADAGIVRTDTLEHMAAEGSIRLRDFAVVPPPRPDGDDEAFPFLHSTRLYPEWAMAKAAHTPNDLGQKVAVRLMELHRQSAAAREAEIAGWLVPLDYHPVEGCLRELRVRPFENYGRVTVGEAIRQHWPFVTALAALILGLIVITSLTLHLNRQLIEARREAIRAAEAKSLFLANMSHEIRTPMNAVIGMTDLLLESRLSPEQNEFAHIIKVSGETLLALINDILDFSKIEAGKMELERKDFDPAKCVGDTLDLMVSKAAEKDIELAYEIDSNVPSVVRGDPGRVRQVLLNLLSNAVKFTPQGEVVIHVSAETRGGAPMLHFAVRDTGIGIEHDKLDQIFRAFSQADASTTRRYGGTGLGLSISRRLAELMGGRMWAESRSGEGSTFHFTIRAGSTQVKHRIQNERHPFRPENCDVLIVDDNDTNLDILSRQLTRWGLNPVVYPLPSQALRSIESGRSYALMISDMQMPEMDGTELVRAVRLHRSGDELPIILLSSMGLDRMDDSLEVACRLSKPVKPERLYRVIDSILRGNAPQQGEKSDPAPAASGSGLRILVAEDNQLNRLVALRTLEKLGCRPDFAHNGVEALERLEEKEYDVVLMDIQMPRMDGLEATREIHRRFSERRPAVIGTTAHASSEERGEGLAAGMDEYLTKPVQLARLRELLQDLNEARS